MDGLKGVSGGRKQLFNRLHRRMILDYLSACGREATKLEFNIGDEALDRLIAVEKDENPAYDVADRALTRTELLGSQVVELRRSITDLRRVVESLPETLSQEIGRHLFQSVIDKSMPALPPRVDINIRVPGPDAGK